MGSIDTTVEEGMDHWTTRWKEQRTGWHLHNVNPNLIKYLDRLTQSSESRKFFLPLCGQTYDIKYLHGLGHQVFAIEGVKEAIDGVNERDDLKLQFDPDESTFVSEDGQIVIYIGDVLDCPIEKWGPFDCVWDRASLIAMNYGHRRPYIDIIKRSVMKSKDEYCDFRMMLDTVLYDKSLFPGHPRSVDESDLKELYGDWAYFETLETGPCDYPSLHGLDASIILYFLTPNNSPSSSTN